MKDRVVSFGLCFVGAAALVGGVVGCSTAPRPAPEQLKEGINVFSATPEVGMSGAFKKGTAVVYFETLRGLQRPEFYRKTEPELGEYEVDSRFVDVKGNTIALARAGDTFVDPTWGNELDRQEKLNANVVDDVARGLAADASAALATHPFETNVAFHQATLIDLGRAYLAKAVLEPGVVGKGADPNHADQPYVQKYNQGYAQFWVYFKDEACHAWICPGHHSAVMVRKANGAYFYAGNHGAYPYQMWQVSCYGDGYNATIDLEESWNTGVWGYGGCVTPYNWNSGGGTHNCHDDSMHEGYSVRYGARSTWWNECQGYNWWKAPGTWGHPCP